MPKKENEKKKKADSWMNKNDEIQESEDIVQDLKH